MSDPVAAPAGGPGEDAEDAASSGPHARDPFPATDMDAAGTPVVDVPAGRWIEAALHARDSLGMDYIDWLSAVDVPDGDPPGVDVVAHVVDSRSTRGTSPRPGESGDAGAASRGGAAPGGMRRMLLRTRVPDADPQLPSLTSVWPGVAWHERETFEMFGVRFEGFDDGSGDWLRPLLLPDGFEGTPLRKTFVLATRASKPWPGAKEPGESDAHMAPGRRKTLPPGVPDAAAWGPRAPGTEPAPPAEPAGPARPERAARPARPPRPPRSGATRADDADQPAGGDGNSDA